MKSENTDGVICDEGRILNPERKIICCGVCEEEKLVKTGSNNRWDMEDI